MFQSNRVDNLRPRLAAFVPGGAERMVFARMNRVLESKLNRVEIQGARDLFDMTVERPISLRHAIAAIRARRRRVGVDDVRVEADIRTLSILSVADV